MSIMTRKTDSATAPSAGTISFALPTDIPRPKHHLFERVYHCDAVADVATVVAMRWICPLEAIANDLGYWGWQYDLSYRFGKTAELAVDASEDLSFVEEEELIAVEACS